MEPPSDNIRLRTNFDTLSAVLYLQWGCSLYLCKGERNPLIFNSSCQILPSWPLCEPKSILFLLKSECQEAPCLFSPWISLSLVEHLVEHLTKYIQHLLKNSRCSFTEELCDFFFFFLFSFTTCSPFESELPQAPRKTWRNSFYFCQKSQAKCNSIS